MPSDERPTPLLENLVLFTRALRAAGIRVGQTQTADLLRALELVDLTRRDRVFFAARCLLVRRREDLPVFESVFNWFWKLGAEPGSRPGAAGAPSAASRSSIRLAETRRAGSPDAETPTETDTRSDSLSPSELELLSRKDFARMSAAELEELRNFIVSMRWQASLRQTRRWLPGRRKGRVHLRRMLKEAAQLAGASPRLTWARRKLKPRPVVLLADVSGSMQKYSRPLLQFFFGAMHGWAGSQVECFVFGTRLTRITPSLRLRNVDRALEAAAAEVVDWAGGTRIGPSLGTFNRRWSKRVLRRGAVVVIASDGWERGDSDLLRREMRYLQHRCHRLIWLNPHAGQPGYEPLVGGMVAALPFVDDFRPIHNLESLRDLAQALQSMPPARSARGVPRASARI